MTASGGRLGGLDAHDASELRALLVRAARCADDPSARSGPGPPLDRLVRAAPIDALPEAARLHRVSGVVLRGMETTGGVPSDVRARLAASARTAALRHLLFVGVLSEIGREFDEAGLNWLVMKGPVVATRLYAASGDRAYGDLDLLVARRDFPAAVRLLEELGYEHGVHNWALAESMLAGQITMRTERVEIDLHWHLHYSRDSRRSFAVVPEEMLGRSRRRNIEGVVAPTFDDVDNLLTLCYHAARSGGHRLIWMKDVERSLAVDEPDLDELIRRADRFAVGPPVGLVLARAERILGAQVPDTVVADLLSPLMMRSEQWICGRFDPIQFHEDATITRAYTRSVHSSDLASLRSLPRRGMGALRRRVFQPAENETDDESEKASYFRAVVASR